jgi:hypothetical protein
MPVFVRLTQSKESTMSNHNAAAYALDSTDRTTPQSDYRARAVAAALTIIEAKAAGGSDINLKTEFAHLSEYADKILEAMKVK